MNKRIVAFFVVFCCVLFSGCTSTKLISSAEIPNDKNTIYLSFDNTQASVAAGGVVVGNMFFAEVDTASFNTLDNRMLAKTILAEKGYRITQKIENADMILFAGCESSDVKSVVTMQLIDAKTEKEYAVTRGTYGWGMDLQGDIKGALKNALQSIPSK